MDENVFRTVLKDVHLRLCVLEKRVNDFESRIKLVEKVLSNILRKEDLK